MKLTKNSENLKILIVEDEALIADHLAEVLASKEYTIVDIVDNADDAFEVLKSKEIDIALLDIHLIGVLNGIDVAIEINEKYKIPFVYLTSNTDPRTIEKVKQTVPFGFIVKPFQEDDLKPTIDIAYFNWKNQSNKRVVNSNEDDHIFIKEKHKLIKVAYKDIVCLEACDNYCKVHTKTERFMLSKTLKSLQEKLPVEMFFKTHRSYIINYNYIESILPKSVLINDKEIPLSETGRRALLEKIESW